jgi:23S rRNA pseudouridine2605 synthase
MVHKGDERLKSMDLNKDSMKYRSEEERLQKVIAQAGVASRRHVEQMILDGRVTVNGQKVSVLGTKVRPSDSIAVDGRRVNRVQQSYEYYLLNKPTGYITSASDPQGRKTVMDLMQGVKQRVYPVGRLDYDTSGLLVLTNDGEVTHRLIHPRYGVDKTYRVEVKGPVPVRAIERLQKGIEIEDGKTAPARVRVLTQKSQGSLQRLEITIHEGRNRQVRRMFDAIGFPVVTLERIQFGPLPLEPDLKVGKYRALTEREVKELRAAVKM